MADWIRGAMWTPEVLLDDQQLYDGANADIKSMRNDIALMIMYYKHIFEKVAQAAAKSDKGKLEAFYKDQIRTYKGSLVVRCLLARERLLLIGRWAVMQA